jgi:mannose-6-phosphate isomerase-like protein (cupin superfamily)
MMYQRRVVRPVKDRGDVSMSNFTYSRLYTDAHGTSCFADAQVPFDRFMAAPPAEPAALASIGPATAIAVMRADRDWGGTVPHPAPARQIFTILAGTWQVTAGSGETRTFRVGDMLLVEDLTGEGHVSRALEDESLALVTIL